MLLFVIIPGFAVASVIAILFSASILIIAWKYYPELSIQRRETIAGLVFLTFAFLLLAGFLSFSVDDSRLLESGTRAPYYVKLGNWMGIGGHYTAGFFFRLLGAGAFLLPCLLLLLGFDFMKAFIPAGRGVFAYVWLLGTLAVVSILEKATNPGPGFDSAAQVRLNRFGCRSGGEAGYHLNEIMESYTGNIGAVLLPVLFLLIIVLMQTGIEFRKVKNFLLSGRDVLIAGFLKVFGSIRDTAFKLRCILAGKLKQQEREEDESGQIERPRISRNDAVDEEEFAPTRMRNVSDNDKKPGMVTTISRGKKIAGRHATEQGGPYRKPPLSLLVKSDSTRGVPERRELNEQGKILEKTLASYGIESRVVRINPGPIITSYEIKPEAGVKINKIVSLSDDLAMTLKAQRIRIVAPVPGKSVVGVEVPNRKPETVYLRDILSHKLFQHSEHRLPIAMGKTTTGEPCVSDLAGMPHLLIAGATGSGKSVCINTIISSILYKFGPDQVRFIMIDPKILELTLYSSIPHLLSPVITSHEDVMGALQWTVNEMETRYKKLARLGVRNIDDYNRRIHELKEHGEDVESQDENTLPFIIIVIDELADLVVTIGHEIDIPIARLAQKARAVGIHLILATQRPSVNVITGTIKANFPSRIAFQVASRIDSRTIIDGMGADKLLGKGDMLFMEAGRPELVRLHGPLVSGDEIKRMVGFILNQKLDTEIVSLHDAGEQPETGDSQGGGFRDLSDQDALFEKALELVVIHQQGSISLLQRRLKVGYSRAARLIDQLESAGIVGEFDGSKAREVLVDQDYLEQIGSGNSSTEAFPDTDEK